MEMRPLVGALALIPALSGCASPADSELEAATAASSVLAEWALLERNAGRIRGITGREPCRLFRPHAGWRGGEMYGGLTRAGYQLAGWSWGMWDFDWGRERSAERLAPRLARKASAGDIIVIHDGHHKDPRADRRHAAETVRRLVPSLQARGFALKGLC